MSQGLVKWCLAGALAGLLLGVADALALAVRIDCPIIVSDEVIDEAGRSPDSVHFDDESVGDT